MDYEYAFTLVHVDSASSTASASEDSADEANHGDDEQSDWFVESSSWQMKRKCFDAKKEQKILSDKSSSTHRVIAHDPTQEEECMGVPCIRATWSVLGRRVREEILKYPHSNHSHAIASWCSCRSGGTPFGDGFHNAVFTP